MNLFPPRGNRLWFRLGLALVAVSGALVLIPTSFGSRAGASATKHTGSESPFHITRSDAAGLENYDIRLDKSSAQKIADMRQSAGRGASDLTATKQNLLNAEAELRQTVPSLEIEYSPDLGAPEVIGTGVLQRTFLTARTGADINDRHADMVKAFLAENNELIGLNRGQVTSLNVVADYANPRGNLAWVDLGQEINGIPVFKGEVRAAITKDGEIARLINNLAPGLDYASLPTEGMSAADAVMNAARHINHVPTKDDVELRSSENGGKVVTFYRGQFSETPRAELMYFPLEPGLARLAWRVSLWEPVAAYYIVVDAQTGDMLWRKNTTQDQTQAASYSVYTGENPAPLSPTNATPGSGIQGASVSRTTVTLIGNEAPNPGQNNLGWINDGNNITDGNNVEAGLDINGSDGVDAPVTGSANRVFDFAYNPPPGADVPSLAGYRNGVVTNMFYWTNRYHDILYSYGFTEAARNFQNDNFGRGGVAGDRVRSESQDSAGFNNANFNTMADGVRGRMQMYIFNGPNPDRDGDLDQEISIHEMTHGLSNRLIGNAVGLNNARGGSMGEGWGDFYGRLITSTADEDVNAIYASGAYATFNFSTLGTDNYYYGIRRFPYAVMSTVGGPLNRPHNPQTLADIDPAQINNTDGAFARSPWTSNSATEVHNAGEIWCQMLLEVRARLITRMGFAAGNARMLQITTDGMKLTPTSPNFIQARDAIIEADIAGFGGSDTPDIWRGFAIRGAGFGAQDGLVNSGVVQSFALPNLTLGNVTFTDFGGNNNGFADPGENIVLSVPLVSKTIDPYNGVTATIAGNTANYGNITTPITVTQNINYTVPAGAPCGSRPVVSVDVNSSFGPITHTFALQVGAPVFGFTEHFDAVAAPALPAGWTTAVTGGGIPWVTSTNTPDTAPNAIFTSSPATVSSSDITTPDMAVPLAISRLTFRLNYNTEGTYDGMVMDISINGGGFTDFVTAGGQFQTGGYNSLLTATGSTNPLAGRNSWTGNSGGYITVLANLPAAAVGQNIKLKFRNGTDLGTDGPGVRIDGIRMINSYACASVINNNHVRADFDGDNKSDVSVVRDGGTWYLNRSTAGLLGVAFGTTGDVAVPGDYDGDNKTDVAVFRPSANTWYLLQSTGGFTAYVFGSAGDIPVARDYDGDGKTDVAVYRPSNFTWYALRSSDSGLFAAVWGASGDIPVVGDFDGDNKADPTVFRPSIGTWYSLKSTGGVGAAAWGSSGDTLAPADYDGDHKDDYAVFRAGTWYILNSAGGTAAYAFGLAGDVPVPGDYDGDGKYDVGVYRGGNWYLLQSTAGLSTQGFGLATDVAVPARYLP